MKLNGKKVLALILALSMMMSVCVFAEESGENPGSGSETPVDPPIIAVTGVTLDKTTHTMKVGDTVTLEATVVPADATDKTITWESGDTAVATVENGTVTAVTVGTATITATSGEQSATCAVTVVDNKITAVAIKSGEPTEVKIPYGVTFNTSALESIKLIATYGGVIEKEITAPWKLKGEAALGTAVGATATYEPVITDAAEGVDTLPTVTVTVEKATIKAVTPELTKVTIPMSYTKEQAIAKLPTKVTVKLQDDSTREMTIGTQLDAWTSEDYAANTAGTYTFNVGVKDTTNYASDVTISITVETKAALSAAKITPYMTTSGYTGTYSGLISAIKAQIKSDFGVEIGSTGASYTYTGLDYGTVGSTGTYSLRLSGTPETTLVEAGKLTDEFTVDVVYGGVTYTVPVDLDIYYSIFNATDSFDYRGGTLAAIAGDISGRLNDIYGKEMYAIIFDAIDDDGGALYETNAYKERVDMDAGYTLDAMKSMVYLPNGSGEYTYLSYVARTSTSGQSISGNIRLSSSEFILLADEIGSGRTLDIDAEDILGAVYNWDDDFVVKNVKFITLPASTKGYVYHEYDADKTTNTKVATSGNKSTFYVSPTGSQLKLTSFTYVPAKTASGVVDIVMKAYKNNSSAITIVVRVNVVEEADITVSVGVGQSVALDLEWFYDIVKEYASTTAKKGYEIAYIVFDNAPCTKNEGYLYVDGDKLTSPDGDKFYAYDSDDGDYDFDDLVFVGGNTNKTTHATFSVYGRKSGTNNTPVSLVTNRTIDFVVGASSSINNARNPMKASQVLPFSSELDAFKTLGGNDNAYVVFTSLPSGGKLYYNYGLSTQKDVTVDTEYYITATAGELLLKNVTFVPSYSSNKIAKTISWGLKGYNRNGKAVTGTVDISVTYAYNSMYFSDISTSLYADSVDFLKNQGITTGVPGGIYDANGSLTRAQVVTFLYRAAGSPAVSGTTTFKDIVKGEYYYNAVLWASQTGVTDGRSSTVFDPNATVTNVEVIQFMYNFDVKYLRHNAYVNGSASAIIDYAQVADWAQPAVKWAIGKEVLTTGYMYPATVGTRGNIALYLHRMLTL